MRSVRGAFADDLCVALLIFTKVVMGLLNRAIYIEVESMLYFPAYLSRASFRTIVTTECVLIFQNK